MAAAVFVLLLALLLLHEMDAIRTKEWKMFIVLKDMPDEKAYTLFAIAHLPLYFIVLFILTRGGVSATAILYYVVDIFMIVHSAIHYCFRKDPNNGFASIFSKAIIYGSGIAALIHIACLVIGVE